MIRSAFVAIAAKPGRTLSPELREMLSASGPDCVHFVPAASVIWSSTAGGLLIGAWAEGGVTRDSSVARWIARDDIFAVVTGHCRVRGEPWEGSTWGAAAALLDATGDTRSAPLLTGLYTALSADRDGNAVVRSDELGAAYLFWGEHPDYSVVGSTAALVARALSPAGTPERDAFAVTGLAHTRSRVGYRTGFVGVEVLPAGRTVTVSAALGARVVSRLAPWMPDAAMRAMSPKELVSLAEGCLVEAVEAAATFPAELRLVDLTGGKDSRLVLAGIVKAGLTDKFRFRTDGNPELSDVVVAGELAEFFGLDHEFGMLSGEYTAPYADRFRAFVHATAGLHNPWGMKSKPAVVPDWIRLNGLFGEPLRSYVQRRLDGPADVATFFNRRLGKLGLLRPEAAAAWSAEVETNVEHDRTPEATPHDLLDAFQLRNRVLAGLGIREDLGGIPRLFPLGQVELIQVVFALGAGARQAALLHRELFARASPELASHRFSEGVLTPPVRRKPRRNPPPPQPVQAVQRPIEQQGKKDENWAMVRRRNNGSDDRRNLLNELWADRSNAAWTYLDPERVADAMSRFDQLTPQEHQELTGAAGAIVWLAR